MTRRSNRFPPCSELTLTHGAQRTALGRGFNQPSSHINMRKKKVFLLSKERETTRSPEWQDTVHCVKCCVVLMYTLDTLNVYQCSLSLCSQSMYVWPFCVWLRKFGPAVNTHSHITEAEMSGLAWDASTSQLRQSSCMCSETCGLLPVELPL